MACSRTCVQVTVLVLLLQVAAAQRFGFRVPQQVPEREPDAEVLPQNIPRRGGAPKRPYGGGAPSRGGGFYPGTVPRGGRGVFPVPEQPPRPAPRPEDDGGRRQGGTPDRAPTPGTGGRRVPVFFGSGGGNGGGRRGPARRPPVDIPAFFPGLIPFLFGIGSRPRPGGGYGSGTRGGRRGTIPFFFTGPGGSRGGPGTDGRPMVVVIQGGRDDFANQIPYFYGGGNRRGRPRDGRRGGDDRRAQERDSEQENPSDPKKDKGEDTDKAEKSENSDKKKSDTNRKDMEEGQKSADGATEQISATVGGGEKKSKDEMENNNKTTEDVSNESKERAKKVAGDEKENDKEPTSASSTMEG